MTEPAEQYKWGWDDPRKWKPHIWWKGFCWWCGKEGGFKSWGSTPEKAYRSWLQALLRKSP